MLRTSTLVWKYYIVDQELGIAGFHRVGCVREDGLTVSIGPVVEDAAEGVCACAWVVVSVLLLAELDGSHQDYVPTFDGLLREHIMWHYLDAINWRKIFKRLRQILQH